jgi:CRISPR-associated protein Cmr6
VATLVADILNNHHRDYYSAGDGDTNCPPGDWETPVMVSFLAVSRDTTFSFAVAPRQAETDDADRTKQLVELAASWLIGALRHEGAGAKTAAGYGCFRLESDSIRRDAADKVDGGWQRATPKK